MSSETIPTARRSYHSKGSSGSGCKDARSSPENASSRPPPRLASGRALSALTSLPTSELSSPSDVERSSASTHVSQISTVFSPAALSRGLRSRGGGQDRAAVALRHLELGVVDFHRLRFPLTGGGGGAVFRREYIGHAARRPERMDVRRDPGAHPHGWESFGVHPRRPGERRDEQIRGRSPSGHRVEDRCDKPCPVGGYRPAGLELLLATLPTAVGEEVQDLRIGHRLEPLRSRFPPPSSRRTSRPSPCCTGGRGRWHSSSPLQQLAHDLILSGLTASSQRVGAPE